jgi:diguanylate cyclase (GGDEF)-like protein
MSIYNYPALEVLPSGIVVLFMTFPILMQPNWKQERRIFRNRILQFALFILFQIVGIYTLPRWAFVLLLLYGVFVTTINAWGIRAAWQPLPTLNLLGDQVLTLFLLSLSSAGGGPFVFLIYLHVLTAIIFTGQRNIIIVFSLLQTFNLTVATLLSQLTSSPASWRSLLFHGIGLFVINLFAIRPAEDLHLDAQTDPLTGTLNRRSGFARLEQWLERENSFSLLVIDMKRFKEINDTHGHNVGDEVLQWVSHTLRDSVRENDLVIRHGGDEFLIATTGSVAPIIERLRKALSVRVQTSVGALEVAIDLGAARYPDDAKTLEDLIAVADENMYLAKAGVMS